MKRFNALKAWDYTFHHDDGTSRKVIALTRGDQKLGFMEYSTARSFVDRIHDLCDEHDAEKRKKHDLAEQYEREGTK